MLASWSGSMEGRSWSSRELYQLPVAFVLFKVGIWDSFTNPSLDVCILLASEVGDLVELHLSASSLNAVCCGKLRRKSVNVNHAKLSTISLLSMPSHACYVSSFCKKNCYIYQNLGTT
jgi:hypothetical protein